MMGGIAISWTDPSGSPNRSRTRSRSFPVGSARQLPAAFGLPQDPRNWSDDHTLIYLREWGHDLPGNLVYGYSAMASALQAPRTAPVSADDRANRYPALADLASAGEIVGSSVEGEQPKFTAWLRSPATAAAPSCSASR